MGNYAVWISNDPYYAHEVYDSYYDNGMYFEMGNVIGHIYSYEIFHLIERIVHSGGGDAVWQIQFVDGSGNFTMGYMNEYDVLGTITSTCNDIDVCSELEDRLVNCFGQYEWVNGKKLVWARTNKDVNVYDKYGNYVDTIPNGTKIAKDVTNYDTFLCGSSHPDWATFTHRDNGGSWSYLVSDGDIAFVDINMGSFKDYSINVE